MSNATAITTGAVFTLNSDNGHFITSLPAMGTALVGLAVMLVFQKIVVSKPQGSDHMKGLAAKIHKGSKDFLITEYKFLTVFVIFIFVAVSCLLINSLKKSDNQASPVFGLLTGVPLIVGAVLSAFAGWRGMVIATQANVRTTAACDPATGGSINEGLKVAFKSGCAPPHLFDCVCEPCSRRPRAASHPSPARHPSPSACARAVRRPPRPLRLTAAPLRASFAPLPAAPSWASV